MSYFVKPPSNDVLGLNCSIVSFTLFLKSRQFVDLFNFAIRKNELLQPVKIQLGTDIAFEVFLSGSQRINLNSLSGLGSIKCLVLETS